MYGAILGDIIGSPYEFDMGNKIKEFPLFSENSTFTDDTVMTIAIADAFLDESLPMDEKIIRQRLIGSTRHYGKLYPRAGYGGMFRRWLKSDDPQQYGRLSMVNYQGMDRRRSRRASQAPCLILTV